MKGLKKFLTGILAGAMALTMTLSAGAAMTAKAADGTITIKDAKKDQEYNAWRVFDYVPANTANPGDGGIYKLSEKFKSITSDQDFMEKAYFSVGDGDILNTSGISDANVAQFGKDVIAYAKTNGIEADINKKAEKDGDIVLTAPSYGYYVLDTTLGSAVAVDTTKPNAEIAEKNDVPSLKKSVIENSTPEVIDLTGNDAQIGDDVQFVIEANLKKGGSNYTVVDNMTDGLTFKNIVSVKVNNQDYSYTNLAAKDHGFEMSFAEPTDDVTVIITYLATLNTGAKIANDTNDNEAYIVYGNNAKTVPQKTETKTYPIEILKYADGDQSKANLAGAAFKLYRSIDGKEVHFSVSGETYTVDPNGVVSEITTVAGSNIKVKGLDKEDYVLVETVAPQGYNLLTESANGKNGTAYNHAVIIPGDKIGSSTEAATYVEEVKDGTGLTLPSTGGIGTTIFYIIGGLLIVAAVVFFVVRRKNDAE